MTGALSFFTLVEDYIRATLVYLMREKSQVTGILRKFLIIVKNQFNKNVKMVRSNNGSEFINNAVREIFEGSRVVH